MQAYGPEIMIIACFLAIERGLKLFAPIQDYLLIGSLNDLIDADVTKSEKS